ncbi:hypothetical protein, partial [Amaricoccus sp.]|uniref:hypothetical protein n=1 Tax=Amaricoccus sp. TaxID=1872485 RepID=UPI002CA1EC8D
VADLREDGRGPRARRAARGAGHPSRPAGLRAGRGLILDEDRRFRRDKEIVADGGWWLYFCASDDASCSASIVAFGKGPIVECKIQCPAFGLRASRIGPRARGIALQPVRIVADMSTTLQKIVDKLA